MSQTLRAVLRAARRKHKHNQDQAGAAVGVSGSAWGKWERGESKPDEEQVAALAVYCEMSVDDLSLIIDGDELLEDRVARLEDRVDRLIDAVTKLQQAVAKSSRRGRG